VAIAAFVTAAAIMRIILGMAPEACSRRIGKRVVRMTVEAGRFQVFADQRVPRRFVVELDLEPVIRGVAVAAGVAHGLAMRVIILVTRKAVTRGVAMPLLGLVTIAALVVRVLAQQREISEFVVERIRIEADDIGIATFMVGMAVGAC